MVPRSFPKRLSNQHPNLDRFWTQLGSILGGFGGPSWGQVGTKSLRKSILKLIIKMITFRIALGTDFDRFSAPRWAPRGGPRNHFSRFLGLLGPSWGQDGPKIPPRTPKTLPRRPQNHTKISHTLPQDPQIGMKIFEFGSLQRGRRQRRSLKIIK